jgi:Kelch motif/Galactose oxidase, central domain
VGELERNYRQIRDMHDKLTREEKEDQNLQDKLSSLERCADTCIFDYIRGVIDERNALINAYEKNLKNQKTMIAEFNHFDIKERIIDFFQNIFIVKKKLTDKRIIHYFEWGNKNIHFYDV